MRDIERLKSIAMQVREDVLVMTTRAGIGHVTSSFSCMELMVALYYGDIINYDANNHCWEGRDYFIFSKGHANPVLYCILADLGFFPKSDLDLFCQPGGKVGVLLKADVPGAEIMAGSVGCGLGISAGIAHAMKMNRMDNRVFCMIGDAECREGAIWEAALHIGYRKLNNIVVIVDVNGLGATHFTELEAGMEPFAEKWEAAGFNAKRINGHNFEEIFDAFDRIDYSATGKPTVIIADTVKGKGVSFIENEPFMHGVAVSADKLEPAIFEVRGGLKV